MAVPKRKHSNSRTGKRRSHDFLTAKQLHLCASCDEMIPTHVICPVCGDYQGRKLVEKNDDES
ncbi:MAG: 50S ribosomal protein L32 [Planctomycetota bacterium]